MRIVDNFLEERCSLYFYSTFFSKMFYFIFIQSKDYCILSIVLLNLRIEKLSFFRFSFVSCANLYSAKKLYPRDRRMFKLFRKLVSP